MITSANMSNPIGAVKPNFGLYTLGKDNTILTKVFSGLGGNSQDKIDRLPQGNIGNELAMKNFQ